MYNHNFLSLIYFSNIVLLSFRVTDDVELFEQQKSFTIQDLLMMSQFINVFLVRAIWNGYIDAKSLSTRGPMLALHSLLMTLHKRDLRKTFAPDGFWLSTDPKSSYILLELERNKRHAQVLCYYHLFFRNNCPFFSWVLLIPLVNWGWI